MSRPYGLNNLFEADPALLLQLFVFVLAPDEAGRIGWLASRCVFWLLCQNRPFPDNGRCRVRSTMAPQRGLKLPSRDSLARCHHFFFEVFPSADQVVRAHPKGASHGAQIF